MRVDKCLINTLNKKNVINIIRKNGPVYRAEISRLVGLSIPTIMKLTDEFINKGLIREIGKGGSTGGKPPINLEFIPDAYYIVGVDVGTTNILAIVMDLSSSIVSRNLIPTKIEEPPDQVIERIIDSINLAISKASIDKKKLLGIGIGVPGLMERKTGLVLFSPDFKWENIDLINPIVNRFQLPVIIDNVTRAMAIGERWFGYGRNSDNFICINLGYGIGASIVINGELLIGSSGSSGEIGHITLEKNGPLCDCGNYGCLEALASANAISKKARRYIENGGKSLILDIVKGNIHLIEAKTVFDAAKQGDSLAQDLVREATEYIGIAIAGIINFFDPDLVVLEGGVTKAGDILTDNISKVISRRQMKYAGRNTKIVISKLGDDATAIGAASFLLKKLIETGGNAPLLQDTLN